MNTKKAIKVLKNGDVHCWREEEDTYWVTDTNFMVRLTQRQFERFKSKYSSLKRNAYIPDLDIGEKCSTYGMTLKGDGPDFERLFEDIEKYKPAEVSEFVFAGVYRVHYTEKIIGVMQEKYYQIFSDCECKLHDITDPLSMIAFYSDEKIVGLVMPCRGHEDGLNEKLKQLGSGLKELLKLVG
jgi:hypothetical protein